ncbi:MAG: DUF3108 domain-containing protein, partial [Gammaproteobacteria bacterium]
MTSLSLSALADITPKEFDAVYDVYRSGMKVAKMERSISRKPDGEMLYRSETNVTGLATLFRKDRIIEQSVWQFDDGELIPQTYEYQHTGIKNERNVVVEFNWEQNQIINSVNGDSWKMPGEKGMLDKLLYQYQMMQELKQGKTRFRYTVADGGKEKVYVFETMGEDIIETPLGDLRTIKVVRHREDSDRKSTFWSAPEMEYLPVKLENIDEGVKTVVIIKSLTGLNYEQQVSQK